MKYFVATDIHGSAYWAKKVADKFVASGADLLVLLGDVYNHGPRNPFPQDYAPMKVAEIFNALSGVNEVNVNGGVTCVALSSCSLPKSNCVPAYAVCNEKTLTVYDFDDKVLTELTF